MAVVLGYFKNGERYERTYVLVMPSRLQNKLGAALLLWLTKLGPPAETFVVKNNVQLNFSFSGLALRCLVIARSVGGNAFLYLGRGCHRENEIGKAARSRSLGFFVDYGCVEIICPLLCQKEFLLQCKISFRELNKFMWNIFWFTECI